jgi:hypothetical protein
LSPWSGRSYCDPEGEKWVQAFLRGMAQLGWRLGTNFQLDVRWVTEHRHWQENWSKRNLT